LHFLSECPKVLRLEQDQNSGKVTVCFACACVDTTGVVLKTSSVEDGEADPNCLVLLDNQASVSVFKDTHLLTNVKPTSSPLVISGISSDGDSAIVATHTGDFRGYRNVYACLEAAANVISFSATKKSTNVYDSEQDVFFSTPPGGTTYPFDPKDGLYAYEITEKVMVATVSSNKQQFSQREVNDADKAKQLAKNPGYPSPRTLIEMINAGSIIDWPSLCS
jgi:hypothetical protein